MTEDTSSHTALNEPKNDLIKLNCSEVSAFHGHTCQNFLTYHDWKNSQENVTTSDGHGNQRENYQMNKQFNDSTSDYGEGELSTKSVFHLSCCDDTGGGRIYNKELSGGVCDGGYVEEDSDDEEVFQRFSQQPRRRINSCASFLSSVSILNLINDEFCFIVKKLF